MWGGATVLCRGCAGQNLCLPAGSRQRKSDHYRYRAGLYRKGRAVLEGRERITQFVMLVEWVVGTMCQGGDLGAQQHDADE